MTDSPKTEFYVRFNSQKYGPGIHETACKDIQDAVGIFCGDEDCVSVIEMSIGDNDRLISAKDVTDRVIAYIKDMIDEGDFDTCPHPMLSEYFDIWGEECAEAAAEARDHERVESAMMHI